MEKILKEEQNHLDSVISIIDELIEKNKKKSAGTPNDIVSSKVMSVAKSDMKKLQDNRNNPYFGRLDFQDDYGEDTIYIGKKGINDDEDLLVVDWRTDLGKLYNAYQGVQSSFQLTSDRTVAVKSKRGIIIKDCIVQNIHELGVSEIREDEDGNQVEVTDSYLNDILTNTNEGHQLRDIITSIQSEQDAIIRLPLQDTVIVQGAAGSGKSTIALHRNGLP